MAAIRRPAAMVKPAGKPTAPHRFEFTQIEMAVTVRVLLYSADEQAATAAAKAAFARVHELNGILSDYDPQSELRRLCDTAGRAQGRPGQPRFMEGPGTCPAGLRAKRRGV